MGRISKSIVIENIVFIWAISWSVKSNVYASENHDGSSQIIGNTRQSVSESDGICWIVPKIVFLDFLNNIIVISIVDMHITSLTHDAPT